MKFFKKLKAYTEEESQGASLGFGVIKAMDYDTGKKGHLILFSANTSFLSFIKKIFISL
jgi:hypothetical protein